MSGLLSLTAPGRPEADGLPGARAQLPPGIRRVPSWSSEGQLAALAERLEEQVAAAVHPDEVAALLESEGLTDEQITGRFRHPDLFALAATLFARVPRRFPEPAPDADPWRPDTLRCALRGLTFTLPGIAYVLGGRWAEGRGGPFGVSPAVAVWGAAALVGWGWNQALAHRAHLLLLAGRVRSAARTLLAGAFAGAALSTAAAVAVTGLRLPAALVFAAGQSLYVAAATILLVLGRERTLLAVLAPLAPAACWGGSGLPAPVVASVLAATVAAAVAAAIRAVGRAAAADGTGPGPYRLRRGIPLLRGIRSFQGFRGAGARWAARGRSGVPLLASLPQGVSGAAGGVLVLAAGMEGEFVGALTVGMGVGEWLLFRFRSGGLRALRRTAVGEPLPGPMRRVLAGCLLGYGAALSGLAALESAVLPGAAAWTVPHLAVLLALGCTLWLALLLQSCGRPWAGACLLLSAAGAVCALLAAGAAPGAVIGPVCAPASATGLGAALRLSARVTTHR